MIGQTLGHYRIVEKIGAGGMGEVYRAHDEQLDRDVALKVLPASHFSDDTARARLLREARAAAALNHPHICTIHEVGEAQGQTYIAMELIEGQPLTEVIPPGGLPVDQALRYGAQIADALAHAHERLVIHRDLKSNNIVITSDGRAKVLDFGLAKRLSADEQGEDARSQTLLTQAGAVVGTLPYMAPEQLRAEAVDSRTDIYAFGCVLYEMVTGQLPFRETVSATLIDAILNRPAPSPRQLSAQIPRELEPVIFKCLEKAPENRYQSAKELGADLQRLAAPTAVSVAPSPRPPARRRIAALGRSARRPLPLAIGMTLVVLSLLVGFNLGGLRQRLFGPAAPEIDSIAVLPLDNLSRDPEQDYFVEGMHEALITELSKVSALKVISRTSTMQYKDARKPAPQIARELGVNGLIEGSVAREGDQVRITVQLIHGPTDRHLWADSYQRELRGILALQSEVARAIAGEIRIALTPEEASRLAARRPVNPDAHRLYLLGRYHLHKSTLEHVRRATDYFLQAIQTDPEYAMAHAGLADCYTSLLSGLPPKEAYDRARGAAAKALELDDTLSEAHVAMAAVQFHYDWEFLAALSQLERAIELHGGNASAHAQYGEFLSLLGRHQEAMAQTQQALELDPLSVGAKTQLGYNLVRGGRYDEAVRQFQETIDFDPGRPRAWRGLGRAYLALGKYEEAIAAHQKADALYGQPGSGGGFVAFAFARAGGKDEALQILAEHEQRAKKQYVAPLSFARIYAGLGRPKDALNWLEKAYEERSLDMVSVKTDEMFEGVKDDPRFQELLRRMNFPEE